MYAEEEAKGNDSPPRIPPGGAGAAAMVAPECPISDPEIFRIAAEHDYDALAGELNSLKLDFDQFLRKASRGPVHVCLDIASMCLSNELHPQDFYIFNVDHWS